MAAGGGVTELRRCSRDPDLALELFTPVRSLVELHLLGDPAFGHEVAVHFLANLRLIEDGDDLAPTCGKVDECVHLRPADLHRMDRGIPVGHDTHPIAIGSDHLLTAADLTDLDGSDPGLEDGVDAGHSSTSRAVAQEADDLDDVAYLGKLRAAVFVELVDRIRVLQGEPHAVVVACVDHNSTMAGWR